MINTWHQGTLQPNTFHFCSPKSRKDHRMTGTLLQSQFYILYYVPNSPGEYLVCFHIV